MSRLKRDMPNHAHYQSLAIDSADDLSKRRNFFAKKRKPHVVVVGAGVSGLRCADVLLQHGCRVTVLEARNRVGGRVRSDCSHSTVMQGRKVSSHGTLHRGTTSLPQTMVRFH